MVAPERISSDAARTHWVRTAGLDRPLDAGLEELVHRTGWLRTLGGVDPALALLARRPELELAELTEALTDGRLAVVPAVRNCIYVVAASQRAAALAEAAGIFAKRIAREAPKAGIAEGELETVGEAVLEVLAEPLTTDQIRKSLPAGAVRSLGEAGNSVGLTTTLPPALRLLEFGDRIRRRPLGGRIDTEQHLWLRNDSPEPDERSDERRRAGLVADYVSATGPVGLDGVADWLGASRTATRAALEDSGAVEVEIEDHQGEGVVPAFVAADQLDELLAVEALDEPLVRLLGFEDLALVAHTPGAWFAPQHHGLRLPVWGRGAHTLGGAHHLAMRTVLVGDHMAGFWAWDPDGRSVEAVLLESSDAATAQAIGEAAEAATVFLRDNFDHAKMTSIDGEATERSRLEAVRAIAD